MRHTHTRVYLALAWFEPGHMESITRYACEQNWTLSRWHRNAGDELRRFRPHGIVSQLHEGAPDLVAAVDEAGVPTVELCGESGMRVPRVIPDAEAEGEVAAAHLLERGFTRFVFIGHAGQQGQRQGFLQAVRAAGAEPLAVNMDDPEIQRETGGSDPDTHLVHDELSTLRRAWARRFFSTCNKPAGVYVLTTAWAADIIEGCRDAHILVPEQVAVVSKAGLSGEGAAWPVPLTVLAPNYVEQGYQAARLLDRMMKGEQVPPDTVIKVAPNRLVPRDSSLCRATDSLPTARAITFIMRNLHDPSLCAKQVVRAANVSRSSFYGSFTRHVNVPVAQYIEDLRLKEAVHLLVATDASASAIAAQCGFGDLLRFRRALVRTTGMTPAAYRTHQPRLPREARGKPDTAAVPVPGRSRAAAGRRMPGIPRARTRRPASGAQPVPRQHTGAESGAESGAEPRAESTAAARLRLLADTPLAVSAWAHLSGCTTVTGSFKRAVRAMLDQGVVERTIPHKPNSRLQKYRVTEKGRLRLKDGVV